MHVLCLQNVDNSEVLVREMMSSLQQRHKPADKASLLEKDLVSLQQAGGKTAQHTVPRTPLAQPASAEKPLAGDMGGKQTTPPRKPGSPRRREEGPGGRKRSPKGKTQQQQEAAKSTDGILVTVGSLNSMITSALNDRVTDSVPTLQMTGAGLHTAEPALVGRGSARKSGSTHTTPEVAAKKLCTRDSGQVAGKCSGKSVLTESSKKAPSLPVSIPLAKVQGEPSLRNLLTTGPSGKTHSKEGDQAAVVVRDAYSPISRPSSSSSTASAESVRHMEHGTRVHSVSPHPASHSTTSTTTASTQSTFSIDRLVPETGSTKAAKSSVVTATAGAAKTTTVTPAASGKGAILTSQGMPVSSQQKHPGFEPYPLDVQSKLGQIPVPQLGVYSGLPLGIEQQAAATAAFTDKDMYSKLQMLSGLPYAALTKAHLQQIYGLPNGLQKLPSPPILEGKPPKKPRRKRGSGATASARKGGEGQGEPTAETWQHTAATTTTTSTITTTTTTTSTTPHKPQEMPGICSNAYVMHSECWLGWLSLTRTDCTIGVVWLCCYSSLCLCSSQLLYTLLVWCVALLLQFSVSV